MRILFVSTISDFVNDFLIPHMSMLVNQGHQVDVAFKIDPDIDARLYEIGCKIYSIPFNRDPFSLDNLTSYKQIKKIIEEENYDLIHTHTPVASAITRFASREARTKIYYTAHGFHFYKGVSLLNWLLYYPIEKYLARYTDTLITMNQEDYNRAKKFKRVKAMYIPGVGLDTKKITDLTVNKREKRKELNVSVDSFLMVSVGELNKNKNHELVILALAKTKNRNIQYVICGQGPLKENLQNLIYKLGLERQVHLLGFRRDVAEILLVSDLFVFPSYREGLSVAVMEAMTAKLPIIASDIRGNNDLLHGQVDYLFSPKDIAGFAQGIQAMYHSSSEELKSIGQYNKEQAKKYELTNVLKEMEKIYQVNNSE